MAIITKMSLKGKVVVVTGSSKGIGFEIAKEFSEKKKYFHLIETCDGPDS